MSNVSRGEQEQEAEQARLAGEVERSSEKIAEIDLGLAEKKAMAEQVSLPTSFLSLTFTLSRSLPLFFFFFFPPLPLLAPYPHPPPWSRVEGKS